MYETESQIMEKIKECGFYAKQKKFYGDKLFLEDKTIFFENIKNPKNLMIVAHPDDEVIFGGHDLFCSDFLVIYCTNDYKRVNMIKNLAKDKKFNALIFSHIDSLNKNILFSAKLYDELKFIIQENNYETVITHNENGEYGHIQHILVHKMISNILYDIKFNGVFKVFYDDNCKKQNNIKHNIMNNYYKFAGEIYEKYYNYTSIICQPKNFDLQNIIYSPNSSS